MRKIVECADDGTPKGPPEAPKPPGPRDSIGLLFALSCPSGSLVGCYSAPE